jgi:hypothetical protein
MQAGGVILHPCAIFGVAQYLLCDTYKNNRSTERLFPHVSRAGIQNQKLSTGKTEQMQQNTPQKTVTIDMMSRTRTQNVTTK